MRLICKIENKIPAEQCVGSIVRLPRQLWRSLPLPLWRGRAWRSKFTPLLSHQIEVVRDGRVSSPLRRPEALTAGPVLLYAATYGGSHFIVFMLNCGSTSETKVDNVMIVFQSVQVAVRLTDFSIPVLTGFQAGALKLAPHGYFLRL